MKTKTIILATILSVGLICSATYDSYAGHCSGGGKKRLSDKLFMKASLILSHSESLGLTEDQVQQIKKLKLDTKKDLIMKKAEIDTVKVDIKSALWEPSIDLDAVNPLVEKKYEIKKAKSKAIATWSCIS